MKHQGDIHQKYPKIFVAKIGFECDSGWYKIIDKLCSDIQEYIDKTGEEQVIATQVKEKFGGLRFYINAASDHVYDLIHAAEKESYKTCELCGKEGKPRDSGWIKTLCEAHWAAHGNPLAVEIPDDAA